MLPLANSPFYTVFFQQLHPKRAAGGLEGVPVGLRHRVRVDRRQQRRGLGAPH